MKPYRISSLATLLLLFTFACEPALKEAADQIYLNGSIVTMNDDAKEAELVAVKDGKIIFVGSASEKASYLADSTEVMDLNGQTLLPGFVDAHSHLTMASLLLASVNLSSPPAGPIKSIKELTAALVAHKEKNQIPDGQWIVGYGYDPDQLEDHRHPNINDLDPLFPNNPLMLLHVSGHLSTVNSATLKLVGFDSNTPDPENGVIERFPGTNRPTGVLQELATLPVRRAMPKPTPEQRLMLFELAQRHYASNGFTTVQDGFTAYGDYQLLQRAEAEGKLWLDVECLGGYADLRKYMTDNMDDFGVQNGRLRLAGVKIVGDGSPQGKTAFFTDDYLTEVGGCAGNCHGYPNVSQDDLNNLVSTIYDNGIQLFCHANGDASIDMLLEAHEKAVDGKEFSDLRTTVIHSQFVRTDQLEKYVDYGFIPAFFTNHAFYWGDVHIENLGPDRAKFLSPLKTATSMGITSTNHSDFFVTPLSPQFMLWTSVNRLSRAGVVMGEGERVDAYEALKQLTINSAYQHKIEDRKGSIETGKLADFVILDRNPLTIDPMELKDLKIMKTIKEGKVVFGE